MHGQVLINGGALMMTDNGMTSGGVDNARIQTNFGHLQLVVDDGRAVGACHGFAGCTLVVAPYERQPWGALGAAADPFGPGRGIMQVGPRSRGRIRSIP